MLVSKTFNTKNELADFVNENNIKIVKKDGYTIFFYE